MSSYLVSWNLNCKARIKVEEAQQEFRTSLNLSSLELERIPLELENSESNRFLRHVFLQKNQLRNIPEKVIECLKDVEILSLDFNLLTSLPEMFAQLKSLKTLNLSYNIFPSPDFLQPLWTLNNLTTLWLNGLQLTFIPPQIHQLGKLKVLGLRQNMIKEIPKEIFLLKNLLRLTLEKNLIKEFPTWKNINSSLIYINLNENQIEFLPKKWPHLKKLQTLYLERNLLNINWNLLNDIKRIHSLKKCHLYGNPCGAKYFFKGQVSRKTLIPMQINSTLWEDFANISEETDLDEDENETNSLGEGFETHWTSSDNENMSQAEKNGNSFNNFSGTSRENNTMEQGIPEMLFDENLNCENEFLRCNEREKIEDSSSSFHNPGSFTRRFSDRLYNAPMGFNNEDRGREGFNRSEEESEKETCPIHSPSDEFYKCDNVNEENWTEITFSTSSGSSGFLASKRKKDKDGIDTWERRGEFGHEYGELIETVSEMYTEEGNSTSGSSASSIASFDLDNELMEDEEVHQIDLNLSNLSTKDLLSITKTALGFIF